MFQIYFMFQIYLDFSNQFNSLIYVKSVQCSQKKLSTNWLVTDNRIDRTIPSYPPAPRATILVFKNLMKPQ